MTKFMMRTLCGVVILLLAIGLAVPPSLCAADALVNEPQTENFPDSELKQFVMDGIKALNKGSYSDASALFSKALQLDPAKSWVQFLNGLSYHLGAVNGNASFYEMAEQGYKLAFKFDESNWMATYYLGLLYLDQRKFDLAQGKIGETLLTNADNAEIVYSMLYASYYAGDPQTADSMLERLKALTPDDPRIARLAPLISAAMNKTDQAKAELDRYTTVAKDIDDVRLLASRVSDWNRFYTAYQARKPATDSGSEVQVTQKIPLKLEDTIAESANPEGPVSVLPPPPLIAQTVAPITPQPVEVPLEEQMISVDVVMISTEESVSTSSGVNLLNGLNLQFGGGYKYPRTMHPSAVNPGDVGEEYTRFYYDISMPAINYSLNIFNTNNNRSEILARPTLAALNGQQSTFFSGSHIDAATVSTGGTGGESVKISADIGVKLTIQPELVSKKKLRLNISAERTFLKTPNQNIVYTSKVEMSKISVQANVIMEFGETLVLSGLSEKETQGNRDGVPLLQSIPLLQYFFSKKEQLDFHRSVLILITPRPRLNVYANTEAETDADNNGVLSELQARYSDWFKPYPNLSSVFHHLQSNSLYREFRTGDVTMEHWKTQQTLKDALRQASQFLYY